ncbi:unnamed protein product [Symbiodinium sp. CCMP2456]|nr:unnamed protein product [Symbiodinium sp. CCMP2456]
MPVQIFPDAAYEKGQATFGIVLIDEFTSTRLVIGQAEVFAVVLARDALRKIIHGRRVIFFIDNEGAREILIKGASKSRTLLLLANLFFEMENVDQCISWLEREPTVVNDKTSKKETVYIGPKGEPPKDERDIIKCSPHNKMPFSACCNAGFKPSRGTDQPIKLARAFGAAPIRQDTLRSQRDLLASRALEVAQQAHERARSSATQVHHSSVLDLEAMD